jgi:hypothetical protein
MIFSMHKQNVIDVNLNGIDNIFYDTDVVKMLNQNTSPRHTGGCGPRDEREQVVQAALRVIGQDFFRPFNDELCIHCERMSHETVSVNVAANHTVVDTEVQWTPPVMKVHGVSNQSLRNRVKNDENRPLRGAGKTIVAPMRSSTV